MSHLPALAGACRAIAQIPRGLGDDFARGGVVGEEAETVAFGGDEDHVGGVGDAGDAGLPNLNTGGGKAGRGRGMNIGTSRFCQAQPARCCKHPSAEKQPHPPTHHPIWASVPTPCIPPPPPGILLRSTRPPALYFLVPPPLYFQVASPLVFSSVLPHCTF
jgi:hypothetical protein